MNKIRKGDQVVVLSGRDKGRRGAVLQVRGEQILVESVNRVKRHTKPNPQAGRQGGIVEKEMPLAALEGGHLESERQEGRSHRLQDAHRWQARALLQIQRRDDRRVSVAHLRYTQGFGK